MHKNLSYNKFLNSLNSNLLKESISFSKYYYGHVIDVTNYNIYIDKCQTHYTTIDEALSFIDSKKYANLYTEINKDNYNYIHKNLLSELINKYDNTSKITENLLSSYIESVKNKKFTANRVLFEIRRLNKLSNSFNNKLDYILEDGSRVIIDMNTQHDINNLFNKHEDIIEYMQENKQNFMNVINQIKGYS